jgi:predicted branched-subunit amino acid permease
MQHLVSRGKHLRELWRHPMFQQSLRDSLPLTIGVASWGLVAGAAMVKSGLPVEVVIAMSILVSAGTAQLATIPLIIADAPHWLVWATGLCVSLRFMVFSFQYRPYFAHLPRQQRVMLGYFTGDSNFALFLRRFPKPKREAGQLAYALGGAMLTYAVWQSCIIVGAILSDAIPQSWGLGFTGTMALMALACGQVRDRSTGLAAVVAGCSAVATSGLPMRLNILVAIAAAIAVGTITRHASVWRRGRL